MLKLSQLNDKMISISIRYKGNNVLCHANGDYYRARIDDTRYSASGEVEYLIHFPGFPQFNGWFTRDSLRPDDLPNDQALYHRSVTDVVTSDPPNEYENFEDILIVDPVHGGGVRGGQSTPIVQRHRLVHELQQERHMRALEERRNRQNPNRCHYCREDEGIIENMDIHVLFECDDSPRIRETDLACYICHRLFENVLERAEHELTVCPLIDYDEVYSLLEQLEDSDSG